MHAALEWFDATHQLRTTGFGASWTPIGMPAAGGVGDQPAWLWDALTWLRGVHDAMLAETIAANRRKRTPKTDDDE